MSAQDQSNTTAAKMVGSPQSLQSQSKIAQARESKNASSTANQRDATNQGDNSATSKNQKQASQQRNLERLNSQRIAGPANAAANKDKDQSNTAASSAAFGAGSTQATAVSNYTSSHPDKAGAGSHTAPTKATTTMKTGPSLSKSKKNDDKERKKKEQEEKDAAEVEPWWPPFNFDSRNVLKSKLCINLRNCQYELFRNIALKELGWRVVDHRNKVIDLEVLKQEELEKERLEVAQAEENEKGSESARPDGDDQDDDADNRERGRNQEVNQQSDDDNCRRDEAKGVASASKLKKMQQVDPKPPPQLSQQELIKRRAEYDPNNWDIFWADSGMTPEFLGSLGNTQRANHFLGMYNICRKSSLGAHLKRFQKEFPDHYNFFPQTWMYPAEFHDIQEYTKKKTDKRKDMIDDGKMTEAQSDKDPVVLYICKPESGSQGRGIFIASKVEEMRLQLNRTYERNKERLNEYVKIEQGIDTAMQHSNPKTQNQVDNIMQRRMERPENQYIVQKYIKKPALHQGHKYDFRIYVLITSVISPMTIFLYDDGLVRLASQKYDPSKSYDDPYVHLTNYSLNKNCKDFDSAKHKLRLRDVLQGELVSSSANGRTYRKKAEQIWHEIEEIVVKTLMVVQPQLQHLYRTSQAKEPDICCDLLGFDVMLDHKLKPWMLEVNHMPSFRADTGLDYEVKHDLIKNTLQILQLSVEQRKQMDMVIKGEQRQAMQYGNVRRMTVKEHSERVRFDHHLVDSYIPGNKFKRIFPIDPGCGGLASNGDELEEIYAKLEKTSNTIWKKQVGMVQKKEANPNVHEKKKKRKNKKNLLTSMTSHIKKGDPEKDQNQDDDQDFDDDQEEGPEDANEEGPEDGMGEKGLHAGQRRDSAMSSGVGDSEQKRNENSGDLQHILSNRQSKSRRGTMNNKQMLNQSQSKLSSGSSNLRSSNIRGISKQPVHTFVPLSEFGMPGLNYVQQTIPLQGLLPNSVHSGHHRHFLQKSKNDQLASRSIQEELKNLQSYHPIPTLNEILTQLHQDPGFRQRYKEYCRAVLDGRFSFGGIKNPIYDHIYGAAAANKNKTQFRDQLNQQNGGQFAVIGQNNQAKAIPAGVTLLGHGIRQQQARGQSTGATAYGGANGLSLGAMMGNTYQPGQSLNGIRGGQLDMLHKTGQASQPQQPTTSISEAAYFIQRVNRILQNQGDSGSMKQTPTMHHKQNPPLQNNQSNPYYLKGQQTKVMTSESPQIQLSSLGLGVGQNQGTLPPQYYQAGNPSNQYGVQKILSKQVNPYLGLAIQSVSASPNSGAKNQKNLLSHGVNGAYIKTLMEQDQSAIVQRNIQIQGNEQQRSSLTATGTNFNISAQKSAQKQLEKMRNLQENASGNGGQAQSGVQSQSQISMKQADSHQPNGLQQQQKMTNARAQISEQYSQASASQQKQANMLNTSNGQLNANGGKTNFIKDNIKLKQMNQDNHLQNVAPVTANHTDPQASKKMMTGKFGAGAMANQGTQRVLVAGGSGQVNSLHTKAVAAQPGQEYIDPSMASQKKDGTHSQNMNAVIMNDQLYRGKHQQAATANFHTGATNSVSSKSGHPAATAKSLNSIQGRFMMQPNGDNLAKYADGSNAYVEDSQNSAAGIKHGHVGSHHNNATMAQQVRVSSKDGARKKKSQSLARYQYNKNT